MDDDCELRGHGLSFSVSLPSGSPNLTAAAAGQQIQPQPYNFLHLHTEETIIYFISLSWLVPRGSRADADDLRFRVPVIRHVST